jgi:hypothetical protein
VAGGRPPWNGGKHPHWHDHYYRRYDSNYWWRFATATAVTGWFVNRWTTPVYYRYGTGGNVYYENNVVYVDGQQYATADEYYDQAATIATSLPDITEEQAERTEWLPLGVFEIYDESSGESDQVLQLAVSKEGVITGTYYNDATDVGRPVEGTVDADTQRAAWTFADGVDTNIVMETSIYNLTEDEATVLVHFGPDTTQTWSLKRLEEPEDTASQ